MIFRKVAIFGALALMAMASASDDADCDHNCQKQKARDAKNAAKAAKVAFKAQKSQEKAAAKAAAVAAKTQARQEAAQAKVQAVAAKKAAKVAQRAAKTAARAAAVQAKAEAKAAVIAQKEAAKVGKVTAGKTLNSGDLCVRGGTSFYGAKSGNSIIYEGSVETSKPDNVPEGVSWYVLIVPPSRNWASVKADGQTVGTQNGGITISGFEKWCDAEAGSGQSPDDEDLAFDGTVAATIKPMEGATDPFLYAYFFCYTPDENASC